MDFPLHRRPLILRWRRHRSDRSAFTLIEILLVAAILATMTGIMAPRMNVAYKNLELRAATARLEETIRYGAEDSVRRRRRVLLTIDQNAQTYWLSDPKPTQLRSLGKETEPQRLRETQLPQGIRAELSTADGDAAARTETRSDQPVQPVQPSSSLNPTQSDQRNQSITFYPDGRRDTGMLKVTDERGRSKWISIGRTLGAIETLNRSPEETDDAPG